jgi:16S rRNA (guanine1516-N2)-methyltransferase
MSDFSRFKTKLEIMGFSLEMATEDGISRLALRDLRDDKFQPLAADFLSGAMLHRLKHGLGKGQPFARALGVGSLKKGEVLTMIDATAGLGVDAFFAAALGLRVRAVERNEIIFALLQDAEVRLRVVDDDPQIREITSRISFHHSDAIQFLNACPYDERPDVVYLDPMYPEEARAKSALPKKAMQIFRRVIGDDADAEGVFNAALLCAKKRVVVKRPLHAPTLGLRKPSHVFAGKTARYDVYLTKPNN